MTAWTMHQHDRVAVLAFGRPPDNFMDFRSMIELGDHLEHLATVDGCTVVLLASRTDVVRPWLAELTGAHLASEPAPARFVLHDLLRVYAADLAHTVDPPEAVPAAPTACSITICAPGTPAPCN